MKALLSTALFILLTPLFIQAGETMKANRAECFYIIRFKPEVRYKEAAKILESAIGKFALSHRSISSIKKVARTIADINSHEKIEKRDMLEALSYRRR